MNDQNSLEELRSKILDELVPLAETADLDPSQKFTLLLSAAQISGDSSKFEAANQAAMNIEDSTTKAHALLDLLDEIDIALTVQSQQIDTENQPVQNQNNQPT